MTTTAMAFPTPPQKPKITLCKVLESLGFVAIGATLIWAVLFVGLYALNGLEVAAPIVVVPAIFAAIVFLSCLLIEIFTDEEHEKAKRQYKDAVWLYHMTAAGFTKEQATALRKIHPTLDPEHLDPRIA